MLVHYETEEITMLTGDRKDRCKAVGDTVHIMEELITLSKS